MIFWELCCLQDSSATLSPQPLITDKLTGVEKLCTGNSLPLFSVCKLVSLHASVRHSCPHACECMCFSACVHASGSAVSVAAARWQLKLSQPALCCSAASSQTSTQPQNSCFTSQNVCAARWWIQTLWCHPHLLMSPQPARPCEGSPDCIRQMDVAQTEERSRHIFSDRCCRSAAAESSLLSDKGHHRPFSDYLALLQ